MLQASSISDMKCWLILKGEQNLKGKTKPTSDGKGNLEKTKRARTKGKAGHKQMQII